MSELNRENIIKALECCNDENLPQCAKCPYLDNKVDCFGLGNEALALIKELIEENERLSLDLLATTKTAESIKADTIREMRELLHARKVSYGNIAFRVVPLDDIDQITKELLEGKQ